MRKNPGKYQKFLLRLVSSLRKAASDYAPGSKLTVDSSYALPVELDQFPAIAKKKNDKSLKAFLSRFALLHNNGKDDHFILLAGDMSSIDRGHRQDMVDMARIFSARQSSLSVMSYGEKPDFAFLTQLVEKGDGYLSVRTDHFDIERWAKTEIEHVHAYPLRDVTLRIQALNGVVLKQVMSPTNLQISDNGASLHLDKIMTGQQFVMMVKLAVPPIKKSPGRKVLSVSGSYLSGLSDHFYTVNTSENLGYAIDRNNARPLKNSRLVRSHLILKTNQTIMNVHEQVNNSRNYQAIATLTEQQLLLEKYLQKNKDEELDRDVRLLKQYAMNLKEFDDSWFQQWKIWKDMSWDRNRFSQHFD